MFRTSFVALVLLLTLPGVGFADSHSESPAARAAATISRPGLAAAIRFLAADELEGRGPGSRGDRVTRAYLAAELEEAGLAPGGPNGSWEQPFPIVGIESVAPPTWRFSAAAGRPGAKTVELRRSEDFVAAAGVQQAQTRLADAELVFVGFGIQAPEFAWDDFKGADLKGKVLVILNNDPDWDDQLFAGKRRLYYGRWTYKYESAARQGAAGAILIHTTPSAAYPWQVVQSSWSGEQFELPARPLAVEPRVQVTSWVTEESAARLVSLGGQRLDVLVEAAKRRDFRPIPLGVRTSLTLENKIHQVETANVAGLLAGSDPQLTSEVVVYTAHHDHLGIAAPDAGGDAIYNGAVDNASGSAQILEIARAFAALDAGARPRRSVLFLFVAAEEQGLLGSEHYATHPTFPAGRIATNINLDSANVYGRTKDITYVGYGKSTLDGVVERAAAAQGRVVRGDQAPEKGSFYRSDQFNFARVGVPAIYLDPGTEFLGSPPDAAADAGARRAQQESYDSTCYHQPCDEIVDDWNYDGMIEDAQLAFAIGLEISNAGSMPTWKPGDEFEAARLKAIAALAASAGEPPAGR